MGKASTFKQLRVTHTGKMGNVTTYDDILAINKLGLILKS